MWKELINSDSLKYGGSGIVNNGLFKSVPVKFHGRENSIAITVPPLGITILVKERDNEGYDLIGS